MKHLVHNLIILDESGSMESIKTPTVQSFNEIIQTAKAMELQYPEQEHRISFITFNGAGRKIHLWNEPITNAELIDLAKYNPDASTPLYDTIGFAASKLNIELSGVALYNVLVTLFTDGEENASTEWSAHEVRKLVENLQNHRWTFTYIGTDHDVSASATRISITNTISFSKDATGMKKCFLRKQLRASVTARRFEVKKKQARTFISLKSKLNALTRSHSSGN